MADSNLKKCSSSCVPSNSLLAKVFDELLVHGTNEVKGILRYEADCVLECKTCQSWFRDASLFIHHKRLKCLERSTMFNEFKENGRVAGKVSRLDSNCSSDEDIPLSALQEILNKSESETVEINGGNGTIPKSLHDKKNNPVVSPVSKSKVKQKRSNIPAKFLSADGKKQKLVPGKKGTSDPIIRQNNSWLRINNSKCLRMPNVKETNRLKNTSSKFLLQSSTVVGQLPDTNDFSEKENVSKDDLSSNTSQNILLPTLVLERLDVTNVKN